ncbi:MAG: glycine cleavage system aminomethyltransferase GcvT [Anaerolineae bacterium]|nr:glycine cleavage system aminomethyltransferase GcvT [Anaerolineae bacterium]
MSEYWDTFLGAGLKETDPAIRRLIGMEEERQAGRLILIPSESMAPLAVREALGSVFNNIYAEGYPALRMMQDDEELLLDVEHQLAYYRRYSDGRFYKGAEYVDILESLAQRRCADAFANDLVPSQNLYANVQPLSGAVANLAVYDALMDPGDTLMGMDLYMGGHLTHGSQFNISGRRYKVVSYGVGDDGQLDYDRIREQAIEARPSVIVAGFTSYPWAPDWVRFREIADACGAFLMADIAHPAGMAVAGAYPSPVGYADVITFTTHKTLCGPRGAVILTADRDLSRRINAAVFPGIQGGPHPNKFAAMAVAFHIAQTEPFRRLMFRITENARALASSLEKRGLVLAYGGTNTHLLLVDLRQVETPDGLPLRGETAVRILELAGLVANKNTIPGDNVTALGSGVRLGTPWLTQRGMGPEEMDRVADCIARVLTNIHPFCYAGMTCELPRGKIEADVLQEVRRDVAELAGRALTDVPVLAGSSQCSSGDGLAPEGRQLLLVQGRRARSFLREACTGSVSCLAQGQWERTLLLDADGRVVDDVYLCFLGPDSRGRDRYLMAVSAERCAKVKFWLEGLSDGYTVFDREDMQRKVEGPVTVVQVEAQTGEGEIAAAVASLRTVSLAKAVPAATDALALYREGHQGLFALTKPYFVGQAALRPVLPEGDKPEFSWQPSEGREPRRTVLYQEHRRLGGKMIPFAGWDMPVWYTSVGEEHRAVREAAGLFDVSHMGIFEVSGPYATAFLDVVGSNYAGWLQPGQSHYSYLLDPDGNVIDDIMLYCLERGRYLMVVNAANAEKDWAWLNAVNEGRVLIDRRNPAAEVEGRAVLRDLKDPAAGADGRVDIALQGPASLATLQALTEDQRLRDALARVRRTDLIRVTLAGMDLIVARTGYTGEDIAYEIFVHPEDAVRLWNQLLDKGEQFEVKPCGLAARDSTRIEAGLPLYGHELNGPLGILPQEAGFAAYLKAHKPFYIGREPVMARAAASTRQLVRFQVDEPGQRALRGGDQGEPVVNRRGMYIGRVTSAALVGGTQVGMALVDRRYATVGTPLAIFPGAARGAAKAPADLAQGDSVVLPIDATVVTRFPARERRGVPARGG